MWPKIALILICGTLMACAPRGAIVMVPVGATPAPRAVVPVMVATTRQRQPDGSFNGDRSETLSFLRVDVAVPVDRRPGDITFPRRPAHPDPARDFLVARQTDYASETAFRDALSPALRQTGGEAVVYVHGFNNTFAEGIYRIAQLKADIGVPALAVQYSWPSRGTATGYVYDRDSMLFARDGLERLLSDLRAAGARRITLVAHSMGSALVIESLRDLTLRGDRATLARIDGVILLSPDIDVQLFHQMAVTIGQLPQPFVIFGSRRDKVLRLSGLLTGQKDRLGSLANLSEVADLQVTYLDVGAFSTGAGHFTPGNSPSLLRLLAESRQMGAAFNRDASGAIDLLPGVILQARRATQVILKPVSLLTGQPLN